MSSKKVVVCPKTYTFLSLGPVKLIKLISHSFLQSVSDQFHLSFKLSYVILQMAVKEFFETYF